MDTTGKVRTMISEERRGIGTLQETSLHAALITWYTQPGDDLEVPVEGFIVDIVRGEQLVEIQTRNFVSLKDKVSRLLENHPVRLVYPVPQEKWIIRLAGDGQTRLSRRKSPQRGRVENLFTELVRLAPLLTHPHLSIEVLLIGEEEIWLNDGRGSRRRRGWSISNRRLLGVISSRVLASAADYRAFLPSDLPQPFTRREGSHALNLSPSLTGKMLYCLRAMGMLRVVGKQGRARLYLLEM
jgi:hypothetical protein